MNLLKISYISALLLLGLALIYSIQYVSLASDNKNEMFHAQKVVEVDNEVIVTLKIRNNYSEDKNYAYEIQVDGLRELANSVVVPGEDTVEVGASFSRDRVTNKIAVLLYDGENLLMSTNYYVSKGGESYG